MLCDGSKYIENVLHVQHIVSLFCVLFQGVRKMWENVSYVILFCNTTILAM